jgi:F-type H+-transporting ATPase subunit delta
MSDLIIAKRYANALSAVIESNDALEEALDELTVFAEAYTSNPELRMALINPSITAKTRQNVFEAILAIDEGDTLSKRTIQVLYKRKRLELIALVAQEFKQIVDRRLKRTVAHLDSATALTAEQENQIQNSLSSFSGKSVQLDTQLNPDILGGIVVRMGDTIIDGSLRTRLAQLKQALLAEENG